jgi:hypothetical protein
MRRHRSLGFLFRHAFFSQLQSLCPLKNRKNLPITTNPEVRFMVAGKRVIMGQGECWYNDFTELHSVHNDGDGDRVHLTIDCVVNDALRAELLAAARA